jgi:Amt family ammonium transporter
VGSFILYKVTDLIIPLRVTEEQERVGLDLSQHGETALGADLFGTPKSNGEPTGEPVAAAHS